MRALAGLHPPLHPLTTGSTSVFIGALVAMRLISVAHLSTAIMGKISIELSLLAWIGALLALVSTPMTETQRKP